MKLLSIIFFISAALSVFISVLAFLNKLPGKSQKTGIMFAVASVIFGFCELICILEPPYGFIPIICGIIVINFIFVISKYEGEDQF